MVASTKPVWLLDIDGVLNGFARHPRVWKDKEWKKTYVRTPDSLSGSGPWTIFYTPAVIDFINEMSDKVDIYWLTSWASEAATHYAPAVGLNNTFPEMFALTGVDPSIKTGFQTNFSQKREAAYKMIFGDSAGSPGPFYGRKIIWTDDDLGKSARRMLKSELDVPPLLIRTSEYVGLTPEELRKIEAYIND